ncbi:carboxymuconolactone decarboxylase family protein [Umezawaea sp. NPDC059074]|uniref:carboxymuconolactone decarboxylase family protein n=1 Tax=Umezawaea sp. NPDC059074 TaxID=3346716 RepID=UPI0036B37396
MTRLPRFTPADLDADQRALYDTITGGPRSSGPQRFRLVDDEGALEGPFNAMLVAPPVGHALQGVGAAVRYRTTLTDRVREMAILAVAAKWDSGVERTAHEPIAAAAGVTPEQLEALRAFTTPPDLADDAERAALRVVFALLREEDLDDAEYADAVATIGHRMVFELTALAGYYATLALQLRVFRVSPPAERGHPR